MELHQCGQCSNQTKNARFCSRACSSEYERVTNSRPDPICLNCGNKIILSSRSKSKVAAKFCSQTCANRHRGILARTNTPLKKVHRVFGWAAIQKAAVERDGFCQGCGALDDLVVHHMIDRYHNDLTDLVTLCRKCHGYVTCIEKAELVRREYGDHFHKFVKV